MQSTINYFRFALLIFGVCLFCKSASSQNFYFGDIPDITPKEQKIKNKKHIKNISDDYYIYQEYDYSNTYCPKENKNILGRKVPKYQDDYAIFDIYGENKNLKCKDVYYPYNYTVPK